MCESNDFTQKTGARNLNTQNHKENGQQKQWTVSDGIIIVIRTILLSGLTLPLIVDKDFSIPAFIELLISGDINRIKTITIRIINLIVLLFWNPTGIFITFIGMNIESQ